MARRIKPVGRHLESILDGAQAHCTAHESDHEGLHYQVGDLECVLRRAWDLMSSDQRVKLIDDPFVREVIEWGTT